MEIFEKWHDPKHLDQIPLHLGMLLHHLVEKVKSLPAVRRRATSTPGESLIARINLFATQNISRPFSLTELAAHIGLSPAISAGGSIILPAARWDGTFAIYAFSMPAICYTTGRNRSGKFPSNAASTPSFLSAGRFAMP